MKKRFILSLIFVCITALMSQAQVSINTSGAAPDSSAMLDIASTDKGILIPRMTSAERDGIDKPADALLIYNLEDSCFNYFNGEDWISFEIELPIDSDMQSLSLSGDSLLIANGHGIAITELEQQLLVTKETCVPSNMLSITEQFTFSFNPQKSIALWQSWTASYAGTLTYIDWKEGTSIDHGVAQIYQGVGHRGTLLGEIPLGTSYGTTWRTIDFDSLEIRLEKDSAYTLSLRDSANVFSWKLNDTNPYAGGRSSDGAGTDFLMKVFADSCYTTSFLSLPTDSSWNLSHIDSLYFSDGTYQTTAATDDQDLSLDGNKLLISNGNGVTMEELNAAIFSHPPCQEVAIAEQFLGSTNFNKSQQWQAWTATKSGGLSSMGVYWGASNRFDGGYVSLYLGEADNGTLIKQIEMSPPGGNYSVNTNVWQILDLSSMGVTLKENTLYSILIEDTVDNFTWRAKNNDPYVGGTSSESGYDFYFGIYIDTCLHTSIISETDNDSWDLSAIENIYFTDGSYLSPTKGILNNPLGIEVDPSKAKLQVSGTAGIQSYSAVGIYDENGYSSNNSSSTGSTGGTSGANIAHSIYASGSIAGSEFVAFSDARIKEIQGISDAEQDLRSLMGIEITDYRLIDSLQYGNKAVKKVIAQQVAEVYPQAVSSSMTDVIPDIYQRASIHDGWIELNTTLVTGDRVRLIYENKDQILEVEEVTENAFQVNLNHQGAVFVYGKEVNDFHTVDYEALTTLNISATQAQQKLIVQQQALIERQQALLDAQQQQFDKQQAQLDRLTSAFKALSMQMEKTK